MLDDVLVFFFGLQSRLLLLQVGNGPTLDGHPVLLNSIIYPEPLSYSVEGFKFWKEIKKNPYLMISFGLSTFALIISVENFSLWPLISIDEFRRLLLFMSLAL